SLAPVERSPPMPSPVDLRSVDLSAFPDLVVIYLGMRVRALAGIKTLLGLGPQIDKAGAGRPEGLLHFENNIIYRLFPLHVGMRWYWKDFASMERWTRSEPHRIWWQNFLRSSGGTGFWHEVYCMRGGMEGVYVDVIQVDHRLVEQLVGNLAKRERSRQTRPRSIELAVHVVQRAVAGERDVVGRARGD